MRLRFVLAPVLLAFLAFDQGSPLPGSFTRGGSSPRQAVAVSPRFGPQPDNLSPTTIRASLDYGRLPLYFIANEGQLDSSVDYYVRGKDKSLYFTREGMTIALANREAAGSAIKSPFLAEPGGLTPGEGRAAGDEIKTELENAGPARWTVKLDFVGANPEVRPVAVDQSEAVFSYFQGQPKNWHAGVLAYAKILYRDLWPGIDLAYYGNVNELKYEFIVHPGADPSKIRLAYRGVENLAVDDEGRLNVATPVGGFRDDTPQAYQEKDGKRMAVGMAYEVAERDGERVEKAEADSGRTEPRAYGFRIGDFDPSLPLVLDPAILVYCGFVGGSGEDRGNGIAVDLSGNAYITGGTYSTEANFPVTAGPDLTYNGGNYDAFVAKLNAAGTALVYCGYIGGSAYDAGSGIAVDASGCAYITGTADSTAATFPVKAGPDLTHNGGYDDTFVAKVNAAGTALVYCGYIGGSSGDIGRAIALDAAGNAHITGYTASTAATFPKTIGPDLTYNGGIYDAFVAKVNAAGTALLYCGYIGGSGDDFGYGIALDGSGTAYVAGETNSTETTFPVAGGPGLTQGGDVDVFVAKVMSSGASLRLLRLYRRHLDRPRLRDRRGRAGQRLRHRLHGFQ